MPLPSHKKAFTDITNTGARIIWALEIGGLIIIAIATLIAGALEVLHMLNKASVNLADLLLLFLYLEILAMVSIYLKSGALPVKLPLFIAIIAMARYLIIDAKSMAETQLLAIAGGILLLTFAIIALTYTEASKKID